MAKWSDLQRHSKHNDWNRRDKINAFILMKSFHFFSRVTNSPCMLRMIPCNGMNKYTIYRTYHYKQCLLWGTIARILHPYWLPSDKATIIFIYIRLILIPTCPVTSLVRISTGRGNWWAAHCSGVMLWGRNDQVISREWRNRLLRLWTWVRQETVSQTFLSSSSKSY